jgi:hypothetical protein
MGKLNSDICFEIQPQIVFSDWNENGKKIDSDIQNSFDIFDFSKFKPKQSELSFNMQFYDICKVRGFIDLITDDEVIVDFKSAKRKPKDLQNDPQFMLYAWVFFQMYGKWPARVIWYHLRTHEQFEFKFDWNAFDSIVVQTAKELILDDFSDLTGQKCFTCSPWCPRYKLKV